MEWSRSGRRAPGPVVQWTPTDSARMTGNVRGAEAGSASWSLTKPIKWRAFYRTPLRVVLGQNPVSLPVQDDLQAVTVDSLRPIWMELSLTHQQDN
jgi:hypothetical protein